MSSHHIHLARSAGELLASQKVAEPLVSVRPAPYVTVALAATITGLSEKAIRRKMQDGKWLEGREYRKSPDGGIFISIKGYVDWVERGKR